MNKLEEYRDKVAMKLYDSEKGYYLSILDAFDAAIALDLPVKFAEWKDKQYKRESKGYVFKDVYIHNPTLANAKYWNIKELYQYWIDNIYKPE